MTAQENLAVEYEQQYRDLMDKVQQMEDQLPILKGNNLISLKNKIRVYKDLAVEAKKTAELLSCFKEA